MNKTRISHPLSRGLSLGTISHGQGTAGAASEGELQGAIAGVAMGISSIFTSIVAPFLVPSASNWILAGNSYFPTVK